MDEYYSKLLNSNKLQMCYEIAPERVKQFLEAEIGFVISKCSHDDVVLDLGCGYGRVSIRLLDSVKRVTGIDISQKNIDLANNIAGKNSKCTFLTMDAIDLKFENSSFDKVICVQNGISAFHVDPLKLMSESVRVTKKEGTVLFSSYSKKFWEDRLQWFEIQSSLGLIGEIDYLQTKDGVIVCKDGFKAITYSGEDFLKLASNFNVTANIYEVDDSSIFCEMTVM